ncbi:MAG: DNA primase catalytic subunit PriS [Thermoplasmata archaeon]
MIKKFQEYYKSNKLILPPRFSSREYGFMSFDKEGMIRHIKFSSESEIKNFLIQNVPAHAYYSAAYYRFPEQKKMEDKEWLGADLIFDLDADHMVKKDLNYEDMLNIVKKEVKKIIENFLIPDFGISEKNINLIFSGGRGYHIHVREESIYTLGSDERREIVNYITGSNANIFSYIKRNNEGIFIVPNENEYGWYGKISREIIKLSQNIYFMYKQGNFKEIDELMKNAGVKNRKKLFNVLFSEKRIYEKNREFKKMVIEILMESGNGKKLNYIGDEDLIIQFLDILKYHLVENVIGKTDEPVTTDIHRLIRLPGSLHGKTSLIVTPVSINEIDDFNPLRDAVCSKIFSNIIKVNILKNVSINFLNEHYNLKEGEEEIPESLALFLILRNLAKL